MTTTRHTLPGPDYYAPAVYEREKERIFWRSWYYAGREELVQDPGQWFTIDVAGESVLVVRGDDGALRAFYNVCRHRGARLRDEPTGTDKGTIMCPYHAWCYDLTGKLVVTPRVGDDELDKSQLPLHHVRVDTWQGFVFVNLSREEPRPLRESLGSSYDDLLSFERFRMDELRIGASLEWTIEANWKIAIENYNECLHCPTVHPELVEVIPAYKKGWVYEDGRDDGGVSLAGASGNYGPDGGSIALIPAMTEVDASSVYGGTAFPNALIDISGTSVIVTQLIPRGPTTTTQIVQYLFHPESMARDDFDAAPLIAFGELVGGQDNDVCERVQRGVQSRAFDHGVYPEKDIYVYEFNQRYLRERDGD
jgi:Rieske 2Fe-2S family protein